MKNEPKANSGIPLVIIGLVLAAAVVGVYFLYNSSKSDTAAKKATANSNANRNPAVNAANAPAGAQPPNMIGAPTAAVTVEEFADFQCPSCGAVHPTMKEIQQIYGSRIKFIFREFPLQMHDKAYDAAVAAEAAGMQGSDKFWAMQNLIYTNQKSWSVDPNYKQVFAGYAQQIGLDMGKFQTDVAGLPAKNRVDADMQRGRALQVSSTPTVLINGQSLPYPEMNVQGMRAFIDAELQKTQNQSAGQSAAPGSASSNNSNK
jgi:protein-disulfide isomerase